MTKMKKTMKSIRRFIKALTRSRSRDSMKERKEARKLRQLEEGATLLREDSLPNVSSDVQEGSTSVVKRSRPSTSSSDLVNCWDNSLERSRPFCPRADVSNFFPLLSNETGTVSSERNTHAFIDPFVGSDPFLSNAHQVPDRHQSESWANFEHFCPSGFEDVEPLDPLPLQVEEIVIGEDELPSLQLPELEQVKEDAVVTVEQVDIQEEALPCSEQPIIVRISSTEDDMPASSNRSVEEVSPTTNQVDTLAAEEVKTPLIATNLPVIILTSPSNDDLLQTTTVLFDGCASTTGAASLDADNLPVIILTSPSNEDLLQTTTPLFDGCASTTGAASLDADNEVTKISDTAAQTESQSESSLDELHKALCATTSRCSYNPLCELTEDAFTSKVFSQMILLESCVPALCSESLTGYVRVANLSYTKNVFAHVTLDGWKTVTNVPATYVSSDGSYATDRFVFELPNNTEEFALCYEIDGQSFWDNNNGNNYSVLHSPGCDTENC